MNDAYAKRIAEANEAAAVALVSISQSLEAIRAALLDRRSAATPGVLYTIENAVATLSKK